MHEMLDQQTGLYKEETKCLVQEGLSGEIFKRDRETTFDLEEGPATENTVVLHRLECGHVVGSVGSQELLGRCQRCDNWICFRCGENAKCTRCLKLLCPSCIKLMDSVSYCRLCRNIIWLKRVSRFFLRRLHEGLSE